MALLSIVDQVPVKADAIVSERAPSVRRSKWWHQLRATADRYVDGELAAGDWIEVARFRAASGARVKIKNLNGRTLPSGDSGTFKFKAQTWVGEDGVRHSSLYATFELAAREDELPPAA